MFGFQPATADRLSGFVIPERSTLNQSETRSKSWTPDCRIFLAGRDHPRRVVGRCWSRIKTNSTG
ncbi:unnamed protein product [Nesidiocoris tenuis]|uniref:Uncharacterized protein n=1 Tax=Nesidiocoris tenuis TaxID=355587 RepID=A0A6H5GTP8_9HEMI|nr:unnamed protein product [Nesidiocoris tenuis]